MKRIRMTHEPKTKKWDLAAECVDDETFCANWDYIFEHMFEDKAATRQ